MNLIQADCHEALQTVPDASCGLILCDPPFGIFAQRDTRRHPQRDTPLQWDLVWRELRRIIKPGRAILLFGKQPFTTDLITSNRREFRHCWYWETNRPPNPFSNDTMPARVITEICVFGKTTPLFNAPKVVLPKPRRSTGIRSNLYTIAEKTNYRRSDSWARRHRNLLYFPDEKQQGKLPYQKPVRLCEFLIKAYSHEGDTVLDFCMGSGTTGVACRQTNRHFVGIEKDEQTFASAASRIRKVKVWRVQKAG
jgi:site-specific DNA-methyltransferase (adenine-specific)